MDMILEMVNKIMVMVKATGTDENSLRIHYPNKIAQRQTFWPLEFYES